MIGRRRDVEPHLFAPGDYGRWNETWWCQTPDNGKGPDGGGAIGNLSRHTVTEHQDGTITVAPSILVSWGCGEDVWHGYLERGVWRTC